jgi:hypothetical protein
MKAVSILFKGGGVVKLELNNEESLEKTVEVLKKDMLESGPFELTNKRLGISVFGLKENISAFVIEDNDC